jgi:DNA-binding MarR family transcriptional regulator
MPRIVSRQCTDWPRKVHVGRLQLLTALDEAVRKVVAQSVLISDLVAARVCLNSTDLKCLDLLYLAGSTTAGRVAAHTGLTTGATTAVIDRLERAGFVKRRRDPRDRRVVVIEVVRRSTALIKPFYAPLAADMALVHSRYSARQLATFVDYLTGAVEAGAAHVAWLQTQPSISRARRRHVSAGLAPPSPAARPSGRATQKRNTAGGRSVGPVVGARYSNASDTLTRGTNLRGKTPEGKTLRGKTL